MYLQNRHNLKFILKYYCNYCHLVLNVKSIPLYCDVNIDYLIWLDNLCTNIYINYYNQVN